MKRFLFSLGLVAVVVAGSASLAATTYAANFLPYPWQMVFGLGLLCLAYFVTFRWVTARPQNRRHP